MLYIFISYLYKYLCAVQYNLHQIQLCTKRIQDDKKQTTVKDIYTISHNFIQRTAVMRREGVL